LTKENAILENYNFCSTYLNVLFVSPQKVFFIALARSMRKQHERSQCFESLIEMAGINTKEN
jgi:hypothetical protein